MHTISVRAKDFLSNEKIDRFEHQLFIFKSNNILACTRLFTLPCIGKHHPQSSIGMLCKQDSIESHRNSSLICTVQSVWEARNFNDFYIHVNSNIIILSFSYHAYMVNRSSMQSCYFYYSYLSHEAMLFLPSLSPLVHTRLLPPRKASQGMK